MKQLLSFLVLAATFLSLSQFVYANSEQYKADCSEEYKQLRKRFHKESDFLREEYKEDIKALYREYQLGKSRKSRYGKGKGSNSSYTSRKRDRMDIYVNDQEVLEDSFWDRRTDLKRNCGELGDDRDYEYIPKRQKEKGKAKPRTEGSQGRKPSRDKGTPSNPFPGKGKQLPVPSQDKESSPTRGKSSKPSQGKSTSPSRSKTTKPSQNRERSSDNSRSNPFPQKGKKVEFPSQNESPSRSKGKTTVPSQSREGSSSKGSSSRSIPFPQKGKKLPSPQEEKESSNKERNESSNKSTSKSKKGKVEKVEKTKQKSEETNKKRKIIPWKN